MSAYNPSSGASHILLLSSSIQFDKNDKEILNATNASVSKELDLLTLKIQAIIDSKNNIVLKRPKLVTGITRAMKSCKM